MGRSTPQFVRLALLTLLCAFGASLAPLPALASTRDAPTNQQTAPCYAAAIAALTKRGAVYSQGGALADDPIDPATGRPYSRNGPNSFDCSGLTWWAYAQAGITIGATTYQQINNGVRIPCTLDNLDGDATTCWALGDLAFLRYDGGQHVAIYVGSGKFMDCYNQAVGCILHNPKDDPFYRRYWSQARRIVSGCETATYNPGNPTATPSYTPTPEYIPPIVGLITLGLPERWAQSLDPTPDPVVAWQDIGSWVRWLAAQLWNRVSLPVISWLRAILAFILGAIETAVNVVIVAGINGVWRVLVHAFISWRDVFYAAWDAFEAFRLMVWLSTGDLQRAVAAALGVGQIVNAFVQFLGALWTVFVQAIVDISQAIAYLIALVLGIIPTVITSVSNPAQPPQVAELLDNFVFQALRDALQAFADSKLGWVWVALVALFYVRFAMWLLGELSEVNQ